MFPLCVLITCKYKVYPNTFGSFSFSEPHLDPPWQELVDNKAVKQKCLNTSWVQIRLEASYIWRSIARINWRPACPLCCTVPDAIVDTGHSGAQQTRYLAENTRCSPSFGLVLRQRRRRCINIKPPLSQCIFIKWAKPISHNFSQLYHVYCTIRRLNAVLLATFHPVYCWNIDFYRWSFWLWLNTETTFACSATRPPGPSAHAYTRLLPGYRLHQPNKAISAEFCQWVTT